MKIAMRLLLGIVLIHLTLASNILVYSPLFGQSHANFMAKLADVLTERGHNVTYLAPIIETSIKPGVKLTKDVIFVETDERAKEIIDDVFAVQADLRWNPKNTALTTFAFAQQASDLFRYQCEKIVTDKKLLETLKEKKFDMLLAQPLEFCGHALFELLQLKSHCVITSCTQYDSISEIIGEPVAPSYVPGLVARSGDRMSFFDRIANVIALRASAWFTHKVYADQLNMIRQHHGEEFRHYMDIISDTSYFIVNTNPYLDFPRPFLAKTISVGGFTVDVDERAPKLDEEWSAILDLRPTTVFVSFGSMAKSVDMPQEMKNQLLKVFASFPETTFIWKYEDEKSDIAAHLPNVKLTSWAPQNSLLADTRLTLFITHGGLASTNEIAYLGKPALMVPLMADQLRNAHMLVRHGGAKVLAREDLLEADTMIEAIKEMLSDESYARNASLLSSMLKEQPIKPRDQLIRHIEYAIKFGKLSNLDPYGRHLNLFQYYLLDIVAFVIVSLIIALAVSFICLRACFRRICGSKKQKRE